MTLKEKAQAERNGERKAFYDSLENTPDNKIGDEVLAQLYDQNNPTIEATNDDRLQALVGVVQRIADHLGIDVSDVALDSIVAARVASVDEQITLDLSR